jgi:hypothetical protein
LGGSLNVVISMESRTVNRRSTALTDTVHSVKTTMAVQFVAFVLIKVFPFARR